MLLRDKTKTFPHLTLTPLFLYSTSFSSTLPPFKIQQSLMLLMLCFLLVCTLHYRCCLLVLVPCSVLKSWVITLREMEGDRDDRLQREEGRETGKIRTERERKREKTRRTESEVHCNTHTHTRRWQGKENVINNHSGRCFTAINSRTSSIDSACECVCFCSVCLCAFMCVTVDEFVLAQLVVIKLFSYLDSVQHPYIRTLAAHSMSLSASVCCHLCILPTHR